MLLFSASPKWENSETESYKLVETYLVRPTWEPVFRLLQKLWYYQSAIGTF
jgi:hypothetical protein